MPTPHPAGTPHANVHLGDAARLLEILTVAAATEMDRWDKVRWMLKQSAPLFAGPYDFHVLLLEQIKREPAPRLESRVTYGPTFDRIEPRDDSEIQRLLDLCGPLVPQVVPTVLKWLRVPTTYIYSHDANEQWYREIFKPLLLEPNGWIDCMACYWAASRDRVIVVNAFLPRGQVRFTQLQEQLLSLVTRAVAPVMDANLFTEEDAARVPPHHVDTLAQVPEELRPLLLFVLKGYSVKQLAKMSGKMTDEIEIGLRELFKCLGVSTTGELIAQFVDHRVVDWIADDVLR